MIIGGALIYPEASQTLKHYCFGNGDTLFVNSDYIKTSPIVLQHLSNMKVGEKRIVTFYQKEDWRLSYAINPFTIEKRENNVVITQWIEFAKNNEVITQFGPFLISDNIVHTFNCKPFLFYSEFKL